MWPPCSFLAPSVELTPTVVKHLVSCGIANAGRVHTWGQGEQAPMTARRNRRPFRSGCLRTCMPVFRRARGPHPSQ